jgi:vacuolar-type H+-ATPase catalytic subunit A/Vma1
MYQVINPDEDTFILRGWDYNPLTKGKIWYFVRDEERYSDKLLHCTVTLDQAQCFTVAKESRFYDPKQVPQE